MGEVGVLAIPTYNLLAFLSMCWLGKKRYFLGGVSSMGKGKVVSATFF